MNRYPHLNDTYISERLKAKLLEIADYRITTVIAPAGYGKSTAVKKWNEYRARYIPDSSAYRLTVQSGSITEFWRDFCGLIKKKEPALAEKILKLGYPDDARTRALLAELLEKTEINSQQVFIILDDIHILPKEELVTLIMFLSENLPEGVKFILLSRNSVFSQSQRLKLGRDLFEITKDTLILTEAETLAYAKCCGLPLSEQDAHKLCEFSGGWISLIYLIFCIFTQTGSWQFHTPDIDKLIEEVMIEPLAARPRKFLTVLSITENFTRELAEYMWTEPDAGAILKELSEKNAFISIDADGVYRYHNLLRRNIEKRFRKLPAEEQKAIFKRLGDWYFSHKENLSAMLCYRSAEAWEKLLDAVALDRGGTLGGTHKSLIHEWYESCPNAALRRHPAAILAFALQYFISGDIPGMLALNKVFMEVVNNDSALSLRQRDDYMGESQILLGFLGFNDIAAMSDCHRKACALMSRESLLVNQKTPWTFSAPSVTMLYHRASGALDRENAQMRECMPYYYQLTGNHGNGAEHSMLAETELLRGNFTDAEINYYLAARAAERKRQTSVAVTAEFTAMRLDIIRGDFVKAKGRYEKLRSHVMAAGEFVLLPTVDMCISWLYSFLGETSLIPEWITEESGVHSVMSVSAPIFFTVHGEAMLARGEFARAAAVSGETKALCEKSNMLLCGIYARIQLAAALIKLRKFASAADELRTALDLALPDGVILPFAEHGEYIGTLLENFARQGVHAEPIKRILELSKVCSAAKERIISENFGALTNRGLSERECEIAVLAAERRTTKEIAETVHLSENTVKGYLKHIFEAFGISGTEKNKRALLAEKMNSIKK